MSGREDNWRHRAAGLRCQTCMWWVPKAGGLGRCRRRAPTLDGWPAVYATDWCGDHKLDEQRCRESPTVVSAREEAISSALANLRHDNTAPEPEGEAGTSPVTDRIARTAKEG